jgi:hypothetical protein
MAAPTVAQYTLQRLAALGIDRIFGVPGDYAFSDNDAVEVVDNLDWVACANEQRRLRRRRLRPRPRGGDAVHDLRGG